MGGREGVDDQFILISQIQHLTKRMYENHFIIENLSEYFFPPACLSYLYSRCFKIKKV